jgi:hypothetical protein
VHWSRELEALGHIVRLMPPAYARRTRISSSVRSDSAATDSISHCLCLSNGERLFPVPGFGLDVSGLPPAIHPSDRDRSAEIENARGLARALPDSTSSIARTLRSDEYPLLRMPPMLPWEHRI